MNEDVNSILPGSFRDPSGHVFTREGVLLRHINEGYRENYEFLLTSGLFDTLVAKGLLISHQEVHDASEAPCEVFKTIQPEVVPFISYPFEWSFSQLRDAAIATLDILTVSLEHGLILKDASAYNMQFLNGKPILIDTLSFERYRDGQPWIGYRQFCQHFIAPLALMSNKDTRLGQLLRVYIDGILRHVHAPPPARTSSGHDAGWEEPAAASMAAVQFSGQPARPVRPGRELDPTSAENARECRRGLLAGLL
jgi:hypothetical protein